MTELDRNARAEQRRSIATVTQSSLAEADVDPDPIFGAEAISLVTRLTRESWSIAGLPWPEYDRSLTPYRFTTLDSE